MPRRRPDDFDSALTRARNAVKLLAQHGIPPTPKRFAAMFRHVAGDLPDLSLAINRLVAHDRLTAAELDAIERQFFPPPVDPAALAELAGRLERMLDAALADAEAALQAGDAGPLAERLDFARRQIALLRRDFGQLNGDGGVDRLTGLPDRAAFDALLREAIVRADTDGMPLALLMIDIDHFSRFNEEHGHSMGDQVLKLVTRCLGQCRGEADRAGRYGGEEFTLLLPRADLAASQAMAEKLRRALATKRVVHRKSGTDLGQITLSVGAAAYRPGESAGALIHRADEALYRAKDQGRNRVVTELDLLSR